MTKDNYTGYCSVKIFLPCKDSLRGTPLLLIIQEHMLKQLTVNHRVIGVSGNTSTEGGAR